jgi:integrase
MALWKRGKVWWVRIKWQKKLIRRSTHTSNKELARKVELEILKRLAEGKWFGSEVKRTLKDLIERYETEYTSKKKYQARDRSIFKHFKSFFGENTLLQDIEKYIGEYESYRTAQGAKPATIVKELGLLRRMFNLAKKWRWVKDNPVSLIEMPKVKNERVRYLTEDEYRRLLNALENEAIPQWLKPIVEVALHTGLRQSNLLNLKWSEVNLFSRVITIEAIHMKNKENLGLPLTQRAVEILKELQKTKQIEGYVFHDNGKKIYPEKLRRAFKKACKITGIKDFTFHDLRHTFASYLRQRGVDLHSISKLLGHADTRMTQRYSHLSVENLREAISVLEKGAQKGAHFALSEIAKET